ncbi:metallophosphoesterase family protein [Desulfonema magnum]|uniref:Metallophosphoesterase domain-containing protein n=1 Tax=Desulfonema magnum TaxID=45655 RepID=A0A975BKU0_9BACT|nr:DNA repair exonuclease [Desulfonema magnum]QTA86919.1 Metallophosphoesterase domain-containing protein [Desulfonema magnum]
MFKFLHAADIHLDSPLLKLERYEGAPVEALRQATRRAFENLVGLAIAEEVDFVLISGDLYDGDWKDYNTGLYFVSQMSKLREADIPVYIITGNHDAASRMTKTLRLPENIYMFPTDKPDTVHLESLDVAIHGQGFPTRAVKKDLSAAYPPTRSGCFNIGMLHTCVTGREGHEPYAPSTIEGLRAKGYDYWALGHVHQREVLWEDPFIVFPGNIQGRHIRETGPRGCMIVNVAGGERANVLFHPLDVIRWTKVDIDASQVADAYDAVNSVYERLSDVLEQNDGLPLVARIEVSGRSDAHGALAAAPERWTNEIRSAAVDLGGDHIWVEKVRLRTQFPLENEPDDISGGPIGEILRFLDETRADPEQLQLLGQPLNRLWKKLPRELKEASDAVSPEDTEWLSEMLDQVRPMLLRRLMSKGDDQ